MTANEYTLTGKLQVVFDGHESMELGDVQIPVRVDFRAKPTRPGRGGDIHVTTVADPEQAAYEAGRKLREALIGDG